MESNSKNDLGAWLWWTFVERRRTKLVDERKEFRRNFVIYLLLMLVLIPFLVLLIITYFT